MLLLLVQFRRARMLSPYLDIVLLQPVGDLGQVGGLAHAVDADKDDGVGPARRLRRPYLRVWDSGFRDEDARTVYVR